MQTTINLTNEPAEPCVRLLTLGDGRVFCALDLGGSATIILPGFDAAAGDYLRHLADAADMGAFGLEDKLHAKAVA